MCDHNRRMKRFLAVFVSLLPAVLLGLFYIAPQADLVFNRPLFHFYIVTFTTFTAAVISILLTVNLGEAAQVRHVLAAVAFAVIGSVFFSHGVATPGALINHSHPAVQWSAWMTLLLSGMLLAIAGLDAPGRSPTWLAARPISYGVAAIVACYLLIAFLAPHWLEQIGERASRNPWIQRSIFSLTLAAWLVAAWHFQRIWRHTRSRVDGALAFVSIWLAQATISMHQFPLWNLSWWLYHFLLLASFLTTVYILVNEYEHARQFSLLRYYLAIALIITALLALLGSALVARFSYETLVRQIESSSGEWIDMLTQEIGNSLPANRSDTADLALVGGRLVALEIGDVVVYDTNGQVVYLANPGYSALRASEWHHAYEQALMGAQIVQVQEPGEAAAGYRSARQNHLVLIFAPIASQQIANGRPFGVVQIIREAPDVTVAILRARNMGLGITALMMMILFVALLLVVWRADRIIASRTQELRQAYRDLRRSEKLRTDLTNMIVHDLRTPLSTISASLALLGQGEHQAPADKHERLTSMARNASTRLIGLIDDMLTVNKYESGMLSLNCEPTQLIDLLTARLDNFSVQAVSQHKEISLDCPDDLEVMLDRSLIGRVIDNLLSNALKYTITHQGKIMVSAQRENGRVIIRVEDNGEGIPDDHKLKIFEKYMQAPNAQAGPGRKGTGLGLAFCQMVVTAHKGEISVQDTPGGGSTFVFWLPLTTAT